MRAPAAGGFGPDLVRQLEWEVGLYGMGVVLAYGEDCGLRRRLLQHRPQLRSRLGLVRKMMAILTGNGERDGGM